MHTGFENTNVGNALLAATLNPWARAGTTREINPNTKQHERKIDLGFIRTKNSRTPTKSQLGKSAACACAHDFG